MFKRTISALLALLTVFSILPMTVFAAEDELVMEETAVTEDASMIYYQYSSYYDYYGWYTSQSESESNNSRSTANTLNVANLHTKMSGYVQSNNDASDYFKFTIADTYYLSLLGVSANDVTFTTKFRLYNSSGTLLTTASYKELWEASTSSTDSDSVYYCEYSLAPGTYYIRVSESAPSGYSYVGSGYEFIVHLAPQLDRPVITLSSNTTTGKPVIKWNAVDNAEQYQVYRSKDNKTWSRMTTTSNTTYTNKNAVPGVKYYYKVRAITSSDAYKDSRYSEIKSRVCDCAKPEISVSRKASTGKNVIKWDEIDGAAKYEVWYATSKSGTYSKLGTASGTSLTHNKGVAGKVYYYKVKAISEDTSSANSAFSSMKYSTCDLPRPVVSITLNSSGSPKLTWEKISGAQNYKVYRSTDGEDWTLMKTTTGTSYTNSSAVAGVKYYYKVMATHSNSAANSAYSTVKSITAK